MSASDYCEKKIRLVAFDLDNTLVLTDEADRRAYNAVLFFILRSGVANLGQARQIIVHVKTMLANCSRTDDLRQIQKMWGGYIETPAEPNRRHWYALDFCTHFLRAGQWYVALDDIIEWPSDDEDSCSSPIVTSMRKMALRCYELFTLTRLNEIKRRGVPYETRKMIRRLKKSGRAVVVITNGPPSVQWPKVHECGIERFVDKVYVSGDLEQQYCGRIRAKPDPSIFKHVASEQKVAPEQCAMVGDSVEADVLGALSAGFARALYVTDDIEVLRGKQVPSADSGSISVTMRACMPEYVPEWLC